jgi:uncharacterized phage infection (PIP) family protein YhgE
MENNHPPVGKRVRSEHGSVSPPPMKRARDGKHDVHHTGNEEVDTHTHSQASTHLKKIWELARTTRELTDMTQETTKQIEKMYETKIEALEKDIEKLNTGIHFEDLKTKNKELANKNLRVQTENLRLQVKLKTAASSRVEDEKTIGRLSSKLDDMTKAWELQKSANAELQTTNDLQDRKVITLTKNVEDQKETIQTLEKKTTSLESDARNAELVESLVAKLEQQLQFKTDACERHIKRIMELEKTKADREYLYQKVDHVEEKLRQTTKALAREKEYSAEMEERGDHYKAEVGDLESKLSGEKVELECTEPHNFDLYKKLKL